MPKTNKIVFIGPMGAGKTTIGKHIAQHLHCNFYDSDRIIEERTGVSIPLIFELEGEAGFRKRETEVIRELCQKDDYVLATGGGAVLKQENQRLLRQNSLIVFLNASLDQLYERTSRDRNRPLLQTDKPREKLKQLLQERLPVYTELADIIVKTDNQSVYQTVNQILEKIRKYS